MTILVWCITVGIVVYGSICVVTALPWLRKKFPDCYAVSNERYSITIDDMPDEAADEILDVMKEYSQRAVLFIVGSRISTQSAFLQRCIDEGHILGNHSFVHYFYNPLSTRILTRGFEMTEEALPDSMLPLSHVRSPHGYHTPGLMRWCRENKKMFWYWDRMVWDFLPLPFSLLRMQADAYLRTGGILCMHGRHRSVRVLRYICERIQHAS